MISEKSASVVSSFIRPLPRILESKARVSSLREASPLVPYIEVERERVSSELVRRTGMGKYVPLVLPECTNKNFCEVDR